jgi:hypothetical protein
MAGRLQKQLLLRTTLLKWGKIAERLAFDCIEFPTVFLSCSIPIDFNVAQFLSGSDGSELEPLRIEMRLRAMEMAPIVDPVSYESVSRFDLRLAPIPTFSSRSFDVGSLSQAVTLPDLTGCVSQIGLQVGIVRAPWSQSLHAWSLLTMQSEERRIILRHLVDPYVLPDATPVLFEDVIAAAFLSIESCNGWLAFNGLPPPDLTPAIDDEYLPIEEWYRRSINV